MKKFHGHHMLSLSLSLSLSRRGIQKVLTLTTFFIFIFHAVLVDEGREDPNNPKAGRHRPASETPFDGLGSSGKHKCENSPNFMGIAMGLYRGGGGAMSSQDPRMHKDCAFVCVC